MTFFINSKLVFGLRSFACESFDEQDLMFQQYMPPKELPATRKKQTNVKKDEKYVIILSMNMRCDENLFISNFTI